MKPSQGKEKEEKAYKQKKKKISIKQFIVRTKRFELREN